MGKLLYPDFFNDVFGPIMQPGSSGGFAGPCRIGNIAKSLIEGRITKVKFLFHRSENKLEHLVNFMSDRGFLGGIQGFSTDDIRLFDAHELARVAGIEYDFDYLKVANDYKRTVQIELEGENGQWGALIAASIGGGMIRTYSINGFPIQWESDTFGYLIWNENNFLENSKFEQKFQKNIVEKKAVVRENAKGVFYELSEEISHEEIKQYYSDAEYVILPALLPVVTISDRRPQLFTTVAQWREIAQERNISFVQAAIEYEKAFSGWSEDAIWNHFRKIAEILYEQIHSLENIGYDNAKDTPLLPIYGKLWNSYTQKKPPVSDNLTHHIIKHALSTNAKLPGVKIVPGPMGTGGGYLFSALDAVREDRGYSQERLLESLVVAATLGAIAYTHTNASGEVGCVGESGVCCAMASGAVTWLVGGDGLAVEHAASMALQANIGIFCDPIPGGLEFPCITRTIRAAVTAPLYADMALSGIDPLLPYHEVLQSIEENFRKSDPATLSGTCCGCNRTQTARNCIEYLKQESTHQLHYHN